MIESERHGILNEDIGGTHDLIMQFIDEAVAGLDDESIIAEQS